jgi:thioredoxin-related protein
MNILYEIFVLNSQKIYPMKKSLLISIMIIAGTLFLIPAGAQTQQPQTPPSSSAKIKWLDFEDAVAQNQKKPKKMFIDMYTDWCGWCKKMDQTTFLNPVIVKYMNDNFYAVKFNAERKDTVTFNGKQYKNPNPTGSRSTHELAQLLLSGKMSYPSFLILGEDLSKITTVPGYRKSPEFETILHYFGENAYKTQKWEEFSPSFKTTAVD